MFTGLVEKTARLLEVGELAAGSRFVLENPLGTLELGESIAVSGACLTVVEHDAERFAVDLSPETLQRTILGDLSVGSRVNLERAMAMGDRLGGHLVTGHVDGVGEIRTREDHGDMTTIDLWVGRDLGRYTAEKGSITVDGVSLTINSAQPEIISLYLIPHTLAVTTLGELQPGRRVNLEVDLVARYVERLIASRDF